MINEKRFYGCVKTGRRIWTAIKMIRFYADINYVTMCRDISVLEDFNIGDYSTAISLSGSGNNFNRDGRIGIFQQRRVQENGLYELFECFNNSMYINATNFKTLMHFKNYYNSTLRYGNGKIFDESIVEKFFHATVDLVPLELNLTSRIHIRLNDRKKIARRGRHPLISLLYFSDEVIDFCNKFSAELIGSTTALHSILYQGGVIDTDFPYRWRSRTNRLKMMTNCKYRSTYDLTKCFHGE